MSQSCGGRGPLSRLALRLSSTSLVWLDSVAGTGPVRRFSLRLSHSRFTSLEMPHGMAPISRSDSKAGGLHTRYRWCLRTPRGKPVYNDGDRRSTTIFAEECKFRRGKLERCIFCTSLTMAHGCSDTVHEYPNNRCSQNEVGKRTYHI